jgi:hypothetical protein
MGRATHPSGAWSAKRSVSWLELLSPPPSSGSPPATTPGAGALSGGAGGASRGAQGSSSSQTLSPAGARKRSPAAPAPVVDVPAPHAGGDATSPSGWTDRSLDGEADAPRDGRVRRG